MFDTREQLLEKIRLSEEESPERKGRVLTGKGVKGPGRDGLACESELRLTITGAPFGEDTRK